MARNRSLSDPPSAEDTSDAPRPGNTKLVWAACMLLLLVVSAGGQYRHTHSPYEGMGGPSTLWGYARIAPFVFAASFTVALLVPGVLDAVRLRLARLSRAGTAALVVSVNLLLAGLMAVFTNVQYGCFDLSILVDTMWRQSHGQVPFRDFPTTNPPLWHLGASLAPRLFGEHWTAQALFLGLFSGAVAVWMYWLLRRLGLGRGAALLGMLCCQVPGSLLLSFWWFNGVTSIVAAVLLAAALCLIRTEPDWRVDLSFAVAFGLVLLTKANTAGLLGAAVPVLLLVFAPRRGRTLLLCLAGLALAWVLLLLQHIPATAVLHAYRDVASSRALRAPGWAATLYIHLQILCYAVALLAAIVVATRSLLRSAARKEGSGVGAALLILLGVGLGFMGVLSNGDIADVAFPPMLVAVCVTVYSFAPTRTLLRNFYAGFLLALLCLSAIEGGGRVRIEITGPYFTQRQNLVPIRTAYFAQLHAADTMNQVHAQIASALATNPGPVYFTDRLEWAYTAFHLPSPTGLPVFWERGVSYGPAQEPLLLDRWSAAAYPTVIQQRYAVEGHPDDWARSPETLHERLHREYVADRTSYPLIVVWHRRAAAGSR